MTKRSRRSPVQVDRTIPRPAKNVKPARASKTKARAMREVAEFIREVVAREKRAGGSSSVFSLERIEARPQRAGGTGRRRR